MTATIIPFPLASRRSMILRQARYAAVLSPMAAEHHIRQQLKVQAQTMRERVIAHEIDCLETSIRATLLRDVSGSIR